MSWDYKTLDKLGKAARGKSKHRPRNDKKLFGGVYPFIQTADVKKANFYISEYSETYNEIGLAQSKLWDTGTLCITIAANIADTGILSIPACFPDSIIGFIPYDGISDVRFIKYCFDILQRKCKQISQGTAQDNLSWEKLLTIKFPVPPLKIQCRIADILFRYDSLIENYQKQIKLLEEAAQRLYKEWFVDLRFPGYENTKIVDGVAEGWEKKQIKDICSLITSGGTPSRNNKIFWNNGNIKWVKTKELNDTWIIDTEEHITETGLNSSSAKIFPPNTLLMAIYASPTLGRLGILGYEACCNQAALGLIPNEFVSWQWLFYKLYELRDKFNSIARGAGQQNISAIVVKNMEIVVPEKKLIDKYTSFVTEIFNRQRTIICEIKLLTEARDRLLPKLMKGELL
jgi:type I restriction enzyme S subunit